MRFNHLMNLIAFPGKVHGKPPASGFVATNKMPESRALSKFLAVLNSYIPLSAEVEGISRPNPRTLKGKPLQGSREL